MKQDPARWASTMFDLYALDHAFPAFCQAAQLTDPYAKVELLERAFKEDIVDDNHWRFVPHIQLHEYETILYSDLDRLREWYSPQYGEEIDELRGSVAAFRSPEEIDDDPQTAPSRRIIQAAPRYEQEKKVVGPAVAQRIGLGSIREKCQHFSEWVRRLEEELHTAP